MQLAHEHCALCNIACLFLASIGTHTAAAVMTILTYSRIGRPQAAQDAMRRCLEGIQGIILKACCGSCAYTSQPPLTGDGHRLQKYTVHAGQTDGQETADVDSVSSHPRLTSAPKTAVDVATLTSPEICQPRPAIRNVCTVRARGSHFDAAGREDVVSCGCP